MSLKKLCTYLLLFYFLCFATGTQRRDDSDNGRQGGETDDDTTRSGERLRDGNRQRDDVQTALNATQQAAVENYQNQQDQVRQSLSDKQQERLDNATRALDEALSSLTPNQRRIFDSDGVDKLASLGVKVAIVQAIRKAQGARDKFIDGLTTAQRQAVQLADTARRNARRFVGKDNLNRLEKAKENIDRAFKALGVAGLSDRMKSLAGNAEVALDRFICRNLTKQQRKLYNYAAHVRNSFDRGISDDMQRKLRSTERALKESLAKLTSDQRKTFASKGLDGLKGDPKVERKVFQALSKAAGLLDQIKADMTEEQKEKYAEVKENMKNFTQSLSKKQHEIFTRLNNKVKTIYSNMTRLQASTLKMKLNSIMDSPCRKQDKQGALDHFVDWLKLAPPEDKKKSLHRLKNKLEELDNEMKTIERMIQFNARALKIGNSSRSRCVIHYDKEKENLLVISLEKNKIGVLYSTNIAPAGGVPRWKHITNDVDIQNVYNKVKDKKDDENMVAVTSGQTWRISHGRVELQAKPKGHFKTVGLCNCDGCDNVITPQ